MADQPPYPDSNSDPGVKPDHGSPPSTPRWVKVFAIVTIVLLLLVGIIMVTGLGGEHGPGRHFRSGDPVETPASDAGGHTPLVEHEV